MLHKGTIGEIFLIKYRDGIAINIRQHLLRAKYHEYLDSDTSERVIGLGIEQTWQNSLVKKK